MAAKTGNAYISIDRNTRPARPTESIEIPTANPGFSTTANSKKLFTGIIDTGNGNVTAKRTENIFIAVTAPVRIKILTDHGELEKVFRRRRR